MFPESVRSGFILCYKFKINLLIYKIFLKFFFKKRLPDCHLMAILQM